MRNLYCVEIGTRQRRNLSRVTKSVVVLSATPVEAIDYVEQHYAEALMCGDVQRVFEASHVTVDWPSGSVAIPAVEQPKR